MIEQKQKPNKDKLRIKDITITTKGMNPDYAERKLDNVKNVPQVYYYDVELQAQSITKLIIDSNKFMPLCYVCYADTYNIMHDIGFPSDNAKITVMLPSNHGAFANIFMEFKVQKYSVELMRGSSAKKIHMWGICSVENLLIPYRRESNSIWNTTNTQWQLTNTIWNFAGALEANELISTDRAIISGSDVTSITEYVSPNENARYKVYLG